MTAHPLAVETFEAKLVVARNADAEDSFCLSAAHGKQTVGSTVLEWFTEVEVIAEFLSFLLFSLHQFRTDDSIVVEVVAHGVSAAFVFAHSFSDDVHRSFQCLVGVLNSLLLIDELCCSLLYVGSSLEQEEVGKGFESFLACHLCTCATFRLERHVDVLQFCCIP